MSKFFLLFFPLFVYATLIRLPYTFELKKDEIIKFDILYDGHIYPFEMRWTLFINDILVVLYKYNSFPRQVTLYKDPPLNDFKVDIAKYPEFYPYLFVTFKDFNDKIAKFEIYLFNDRGVKIDFKGKK